MDKTFEIDIKRLIIAVLMKSWIIVIVAIFGASSMYVYANKCLTPRYTAAASLYVNNYIDNSTVNITKVSSSDIYTAQALVKTYLTFLSSNKVLDEVSAKLGGKYAADEIRGMMSATALDETEVFQVQITYTDPAEAAKIVNVIADMAPMVITEYIEGSSVKVVDYAKIPKIRSFPVYRKYFIIGFVAGGGIAAIIIIILFLFNTKISDEDDIKKLFTAPVIGKIPSFSINPGGGTYYKYMYKSKTDDKEGSQ